MKKRNVRFRRIFLELLSVMFLFSIGLYAQNYNYSDTSKTDTSKIDTSRTKPDTTGYNYNFNSQENNFYASNENLNSRIYSLDSSLTDTSKTDTTKKTDSLGYNGSKDNIYTLNWNAGSSYYVQDSSMTDTSKIDTTKRKTDSLGYNNIKPSNNFYAFNGNAGGNYYFQADSSMKDTSKTDTAKFDTTSYYNKTENNNAYALTSNRLQDSTGTDTSGNGWKYKKDTTKTDTMGYNSTSSYYADNGNNSISNPVKSSSFLINPIKDLTQKLKLNVYLMDEQTPKVQEILREYEARTYRSNGDNEELNEAAHNAQKNIAEILTVRQKKEWENAKSGWWASVDQALNLSYLNKSKNNL